jgi:hypothetical protein
MTSVPPLVKKNIKYIFGVYLSWVRVMPPSLAKTVYKLFFIRVNKNFIKTVLGGGYHVVPD